MIFTKRFYSMSVLLSVGLAGCTPANYIQRMRPPPPCDVRICTTVGASDASCVCRTHDETQRQLRETWGRQLG
jgi:hypothetical protein